MSAPDVRTAVTRFLQYVNQTGSPYHSVLAARELLDRAGFRCLSHTSFNVEEGDWGCVYPGGKYYVTRNHSSIMAFIVGNNFRFDDGRRHSFVIAAAHTDSPCLRVRPNHDLTSEGYRLLSVETYGGGLWHTWLDRGLGLCGKVVVKQSDSCGGGLEEKLVRIPRPVVIIPNLAIHLQTGEERSAFKLNTESHLRPIICSELKQQLFADDSSKEQQLSSGPLKTILAKEVGCLPTDIVDLDICLMDATEGRLAGMHEEFVESGRLDNLASTWAIVEALCECSEDMIIKSGDIMVACSFDNEEVGSVSYNGANSVTLERWLHQILYASWRNYYDDQTPLPTHLVSRMIDQSFLVSADCAHGVHPSYADKHQALHKPLFHKGVVIKENCNLRYSSHATTMAITRKVAKLAGCPVQTFVVRNDSQCGSTIGPLCTARLGMNGVDIGISQWAMHSIRETCSTDDLYHLKTLIAAFYREFGSVRESWKLLDN